MKKVLFQLEIKNGMVDDALQNFTKETKAAGEYMDTLKWPLKGTTPELLKLHDRYGLLKDKMRAVGSSVLLQESERSAVGNRVAMMQRSSQDTAGYPLCESS